jgi:pyruvate formate lyase activating enzyme
LHFTAFHPDFRLRHIGRTPAATCRRARDQAKRAGIRHVYSGNISDPSGQTSYCAGCGHAVIERDGYQLYAYELDGARCRHCDAELPGVFSARGRENFGPRRLRIQLD